VNTRDLASGAEKRQLDEGMGDTFASMRRGNVLRLFNSIARREVAVEEFPKPRDSAPLDDQDCLIVNAVLFADLAHAVVSFHRVIQ
jgi:hypothetical protein